MTNSEFNDDDDVDNQHQYHSSKDDDDMIQWIQSLPKVELHAHLNGCIREETLWELAQERNVQLNERHFPKDDPTVCHHYHYNHNTADHNMYNIRSRSLQVCFDMFAELPKCINDLPSLRRITLEALEDFAKEHVTYLELRSTPKQLLVDFRNKDKTMTNKYSYCTNVLDVIQSFEQSEMERYQKERKRVDLIPDGTKPRLPMICRFLIAVDRSQSTNDAMENIDLAIRFHQEYPEYVVGVDLGGNPNNFIGRLSKNEDTIKAKIIWLPGHGSS